MDHARGVDRAQALRQARGQRQQRPRRQRPVLFHRLGQRRPGNIRRRQPRRRTIESASTTMAVNTPLTLRAAATSRPNRSRKSGSSASSARMTFTATGRRPRRRRGTPSHAAAAPAYQPVRTDRLRIPGLQSLDHAGPPTSPKTPLPSYPTETTIVTAQVN